jgi:hypothetical protein
MIQSIFNDIVDIRQRPDALNENSNAVEQSIPRIVYMRDFGSIAPSASLLIPYLLQALHTRRTARFQKDSPDREGPLQPTVLIFGFSSPPRSRGYPVGAYGGYPESPYGGYPGSPYRGATQSRHRGYKDRVAKDFSSGGSALLRILPPLDSKLFILKDETFPVSVFSSAFLLPSLTNAEELSIQLPAPFFSPICPPSPTGSEIRRPAMKTPPVDPFMSGAAAIFVFPVDSHTDEFRNIEQRLACSRRQAVRNAWMTLCLGRRGAVVCEKPLDLISSDHIRTDEQSAPNSSDILAPVDFLDDLQKRTGLLTPVSLDRISVIALGLSPPGSSSAIHVTPALVSRACQLFVENLQARSDWTKTVIEHEDEGSEDDDDDDDDERQQQKEQATEPIVQKVKQAKDLNHYEKQLLNCIVDGGKVALVSLTLGTHRLLSVIKQDSKLALRTFVFQGIP